MSKNPLVIATHNPGKLAEFTALFAHTSFTILAQTPFVSQAVAETGLSFVENALLKARHCAKCSGYPSLADDSGLVVDALQGAPGIYSARYAGEKASDAENNAKLLAALEDIPAEQRQARFCCVLVYVRHATDPLPLIAQGLWEGHILKTAKGNAGFGYDPVFYIPEQACSAAELAPSLKQQLSHRGQAFTSFLKQLEQAGLA